MYISLRRESNLGHLMQGQRMHKGSFPLAGDHGFVHWSGVSVPPWELNLVRPILGIQYGYHMPFEKDSKYYEFDCWLVIRLR